ncbi:MAG: cupredoxin family copper-binding protein [Oligoflexales bacterium]
MRSTDVLMAFFTSSVLVAPFCAAKTHRLSISGMAFTTPSLVIEKGDTVEWTNQDIVPHTVTGNNFDSGTLESGATWKRTFSEVGNVDYKCSFHPSMTGRVQVK